MKRVLIVLTATAFMISAASAQVWIMTNGAGQAGPGSRAPTVCSVALLVDVGVKMLVNTGSVLCVQ